MPRSRLLHDESGRRGRVGARVLPGRTVTAALLAVALTGCATIVVERIGSAAPAARSASEVRLLDAWPAEPYRSIARIEVRDRGLGRSPERLRAKLVAAAAGLGADAVVLDLEGTRRAVAGVPGHIGIYDDPVVAGTAIVVGGEAGEP